MQISKNRVVSRALFDRTDQLKALGTKLLNCENLSQKEFDLIGPIQAEQILGYSEFDRLNKIHEATDYLERE